jgi:hypothetical protein
MEVLKKSGTATQAVAVPKTQLLAEFKDRLARASTERAARIAQKVSSASIQLNRFCAGKFQPPALFKQGGIDKFLTSTAPVGIVMTTELVLAVQKVADANVAEEVRTKIDELGPLAETTEQKEALAAAIKKYEGYLQGLVREALAIRQVFAG